MDSLQTNKKVFVKTPDGKCIVQIMAVAEQFKESETGEAKGLFRIYVAWEWEKMAKQGVFGFARSREVYQEVTLDAINETADFGQDIGGSGQEKKIFANLF
jgi:hypothetical protein